MDPSLGRFGEQIWWTMEFGVAETSVVRPYTSRRLEPMPQAHYTQDRQGLDMGLRGRQSKLRDKTLQKFGGSLSVNTVIRLQNSG